MTTETLNPTPIVYLDVNGDHHIHHTADSAMRAYANAKFAGRILNPEQSTRYIEALRLTETANSVPNAHYDTVLQPMIDEAREPVEYIKVRPSDILMADGTPADGRTVSSVAEERIARHAAILKATGIALPPPLYAPGTRVVSLGESNFRELRAEWESQPLITDALRDVAGAVRAEDRRYFEVPLAGLRMSSSGAIGRGGVNIPFEEDAVRQLLSSMDGVFPRALPFLLKMSVEHRAEVFNRHMTDFEVELGDKSVKVGSRKFAGKRQVFTVRSPEYAVYNADLVAEDIIRGLGPAGTEMRGLVAYNPATTDLRVRGSFAANKVVDLAAGDVFRLTYNFRTNDSGGGAITAHGGAWRNLCLNLIILGKVTEQLLRRRHRGNITGISEQVSASAEVMTGLFDQFATDWGYLRRKSIAQVVLWGEKFSKVEDALTYAVEHGRLDIGLKKSVALAALLDGYKAESHGDLSDILNAVTRAAQSELLDSIQQERLESWAGELVPVLVNAAK